jgi:putative hydrolase of the HAD superfamily
MPLGHWGLKASADVGCNAALNKSGLRRQSIQRRNRPHVDRNRIEWNAAFQNSHTLLSLAACGTRIHLNQFANMSPIKAVLFDLDDTLWPIMPVIMRAETVLFDWLSAHAPAVAQQFTIESLRERRLALMATNPRYAIDLWALRHAALTEAFISAGEDAAKVDHAMAAFSTARNAVTLFDDVHPTLMHLHGRVALGSVSNGAADLETIGVAHYFQTSIAAHRFGCAKPDPAIFHAACGTLGVAPSEAVYVGDDPLLDVDGAQKAGLRAVWMTRSELQPQRTLPGDVQPDAICTTFYELDQWLTERIMVASSTRAR